MPPRPTSVLVPALALALAACGGGEGRRFDGRRPAGPPAGPSTVLRVPRTGGTAALHRVPGLDPEPTWKFDEKLPPVERIVGADPEQGIVYLLDRSATVVALDLDTRRGRASLEQVRQATLGPNGALYAVDTASTVTQLVRRTPVRFRSKLRGRPGELYATMSGAVLARVGGNRPALEVLGSDKPPVAIPLAGGPVAPTLLGDLVAVAADSAVVLYDPQAQGKTPPRVVRVAGGARAALFSPSGHRLYVARDDGGLLVLDRFTGEALGEIELPGPARALRGDRHGSWILVRPAAGDSLWVVDAGTGRFTGTVAAAWSDDLPAVAPPRTLLVRRGADVAGLDLAARGFPESGRVPGGGRDAWLPLAWEPEGAEGETIEADSAALAADTLGGAAVYLQVSSSQNPSWAAELAERLRSAGLPATVFPPKQTDEAHRVVLGPYATREQAEETGRRLGMPSFVITAQDRPAP